MQYSTPNNLNHCGDVGVWRARYRDVGANNILADVTTIGNMASLPYLTGSQSLSNVLGVADNGVPTSIADYYNINV